MSESVFDPIEIKRNRADTLRRLSATVTQERLDYIIDGLYVRNAYDEHPDTFYEKRVTRQYSGFLFGKLSTAIGKVHFVHEDSWLILSELYDIDWYKPIDDGRVVHITSAVDMSGNKHPSIQVLQTTTNGHEGAILPIGTPEAIGYISDFLNEIDAVETVVSDYWQPANR